MWSIRCCLGGFFEGAASVADAGSGAGFPGIALALVLPQTRFTLLESTQKKARFLEAVVRELGLANVEVRAERAEDWLKTHRVPVVTARAVAPLNRAAALFAPALRGGARVLLYKGPDAAYGNCRGGCGDREAALAAADCGAVRASGQAGDPDDCGDGGNRTRVEPQSLNIGGDERRVD